MKKLNKLFLGAASVASVAAPIAAVVSCGTTSGITEALGTKLNVSENAKVWMVSDGGSVQDKTFNEGALKGVADFGNNSKTPYNFVQTVPGSLDAAYSKAVAGGAEVLVGAGFMHDDQFAASGLVDGSATRFAKAYPSKYFIGVDCGFGAVAANARTNLASITYHTEKAGYLAGAYAFDYIEKHQDQFEARNAEAGKKVYKAATFGGGMFLSVTSWMDGFAQALKEASAHSTSMAVEMIYASGTTPSASDFTTDGFKSPSTEAQNLVKTYKDKKADVIFPVAGPQIKDALKVVRDAKIKVIGVDGDQTPIYNNDHIIGSALKDLPGEVTKALESFYAADDHAAFKAEYVAKSHDGKTGFVYYDASGKKQEYSVTDALKITGVSGSDFPTINLTGFTTAKATN